MYENETWMRTTSDDAATRAELALDAHLERQEAKARRDLHEATGRAPALAVANVAAPVSDALNGWLKAMNANAWGYGAIPGLTPRKPAARAIALSDESEAA